MEVAMKRINKALIEKALLRFALVVVAVVGLRAMQISGVAIDSGLRPSSALRNYQNRIRSTQTLLETGRLVLDGT
jgi:hypothetical protein